MHCCISGCTNTSSKNKHKKNGVKFYYFPRQNNLMPWLCEKRQKWIDAVKKHTKYPNGWLPGTHTTICSTHFIGNKKSENPLHPSYVPTILPGQEKNLQKFEEKLKRFERHQHRTQQKNLQPEKLAKQSNCHKIQLVSEINTVRDVLDLMEENVQPNQSSMNRNGVGTAEIQTESKVLADKSCKVNIPTTSQVMKDFSCDPCRDQHSQMLLCQGFHGVSSLQTEELLTSTDSDTSNVADHSESDPLAQDGRAQCRCCGKSTERFVDTDSEPSYITDNKTSLSINGINVEIDFNDQAPKVCLPCNKKLKEMLDFVKLVKFAQDNLIDLGAENRELLIVKTEYDSNDEEDDSAKEKDDDTNVGERDTTGKSEFGVSTHKRRSNETTTSKRKKTEVDETESEESDLIIDVKEKVMFGEYTDGPETSTNVIVKSELDINVTMETDNGNDANEENETNKTNLGFRETTAEPPDQASELEKATQSLLNELGIRKTKFWKK